jgi:hypothetical protein
MNDELKRLREEVNHYKELYELVSKIVNQQADSIKSLHMIFMSQEAELNKLRGETK